MMPMNGAFDMALQQPFSSIFPDFGAMYRSTQNPFGQMATFGSGFGATSSLNFRDIFGANEQANASGIGKIEKSDSSEDDNKPFAA